MAARTASTPGGFNEAGARTPRMDLGYLRADRRVSGASMRPGRERPGWAGVTDAQPQSTYRASMRPGRERPGWREDGIMRDFTIARFNEAGARTPRMAPLAAGSPLSSFTLQ